MDTALAAGLALTLAGLVGYLVGIVAPYPGRAFSVTGVMIGITLLAIGRWSDGNEGGGDSA
ncbi:hypothetical protein M0R88_15315 [Halorussus gelatinilyticus]|uniref:Uncharacterized protein n=1 Tax=Halorussus gelatinilyticus TaxID=2937524 RepID=A0A8U0IGR2_9EURY|nr:hypothetical protein [Halorussus gelatinilyticus]UPV99875.1 hypothetical protein M0R88_15315 [Halorussus gelatinilyticus]